MHTRRFFIDETQKIKNEMEGGRRKGSLGKRQTKYDSYIYAEAKRIQHMARAQIFVTPLGSLKNIVKKTAIIFDSNQEKKQLGRKRKSLEASRSMEIIANVQQILSAILLLTILPISIVSFFSSHSNSIQMVSKVCIYKNNAIVSLYRMFLGIDFADIKMILWY